MKKFLFASVAGIAVAAAAPALAADLPAPAPAPIAPVAAAPIFTWSGFYAGLHAGAVWRDTSDRDCGAFRDLRDEFGVTEARAECFEDFIDDGDSPNFDRDVPFFTLFGDDDDYVAITDVDEGDDWGWLAGAQIGVNQQYGRLVLGLEADFSFMDSDGSAVEFEYFHTEDPLDFYDGTGRVSANSIDWLSTFRARVGGAFGSEGRLLAYVTGGIAVAGLDDVDASFDDFGGKGWCSDCTFEDEDDNDYAVGFAVGVGAEYAFTNRLSVGAEYLFVGFDDDGSNVRFFADEGKSFEVATGGVDDLHIGRIKVNWLFGPGS